MYIMPPQVNEKGGNQLNLLGLAFLIMEGLAFFMTILKNVWVQMLLTDWYKVIRMEDRAGLARCFSAS